MTKKEGINHNLPGELIYEIISWLPAKDLLRFKRVLKAWNELISDPKFIKLHLDRRSYSETTFIVEYSARENRHQMFSLQSYYDHRDDYPHYCHDFTPLCSPRDLIEAANPRVVGSSCDGLVCIQYFQEYMKRFLIYNPTTRASRILPQIDFNRGDDKSAGKLTWILGFGYDCVSDDYKVFNVTTLSAGEGRPMAEVVSSLYGLKTDTWETLGNPPWNVWSLIRSASAFVDKSNSFHWLYHSSKQINCLHLSTRRYVELPLPENMGTAPSSSTLMTVFEGKLCVVSCCFDIWILEEYGNHKSWAQLFRNTASSLIRMSDRWDLRFSKLSCFKDPLNNFILSLITNYVARAPASPTLWFWFYCDVQSQEVREIKMPCFPPNLGSGLELELELELGAVLPWVQTLVPLH